MKNTLAIALMGVASGILMGFVSLPAPEPCPGCNNQAAHDTDDNKFLITDTQVSLSAGTCSGELPNCTPNAKCKVWGSATVENKMGQEITVTRACNAGVVTIPPAPTGPGNPASFSICTALAKAEADCGGHVELPIHQTSDGTQIGSLRWNCAACPVGTE